MPFTVFLNFLFSAKQLTLLRKRFSFFFLSLEIWINFFIFVAQHYWLVYHDGRTWYFFFFLPMTVCVHKNETQSIMLSESKKKCAWFFISHQNERDWYVKRCTVCFHSKIMIQSFGLNDDEIKRIMFVIERDFQLRQKESLRIV